MNIHSNTIIITGGATGIGLALAAQLLALGNEIIICGRREEKLQAAKQQYPGLHTFVCDLSRESERVLFAADILSKFPSTNILINNAGIQQDIRFLHGLADVNIQEEIDTNLVTPIHLSSLFIPHLLKQEHPAIVNITSGLGFIPLAIVPVYSATKAAMHSFTMSLRKQLKATAIQVFEIAPPTVDTELDRGARAKRRMIDRGISAAECAVEMVKALEEDRFFAPIGQAAGLFDAATSGKADFVFARMNG